MVELAYDELRNPRQIHCYLLSGQASVVVALADKCLHLGPVWGEQVLVVQRGEQLFPAAQLTEEIVKRRLTRFFSRTPRTLM